jgi:hypothetical protein
MIFLKYFTVLFCCSISRGEIGNLILTNTVLSSINVAGEQYRLEIFSIKLCYQLTDKKE